VVENSEDGGWREDHRWLIGLISHPVPFLRTGLNNQIMLIEIGVSGRQPAQANAKLSHLRPQG
jgi:hypothetical protein